MAKIISDSSTDCMCFSVIIYTSSSKQHVLLYFQAGLASADHPEQLVIALEPEAASIYCRRLRMSQLVPDIPPPMQPLTLERNRKLIEVPEIVEDRIGDHLTTGKRRILIGLQIEIIIT